MLRFRHKAHTTKAPKCANPFSHVAHETDPLWGLTPYKASYELSVTCRIGDNHRVSMCETWQLLPRLFTGSAGERAIDLNVSHLGWCALPCLLGRRC